MQFFCNLSRSGFQIKLQRAVCPFCNLFRNIFGFATVPQSKVVLHDSVFLAAKVCSLSEWWFLTSIGPVGIGFNVLMHLSPH